MQNDEPTGFVSYSRFEAKMLEILANKTLEPDSSDIMLQVRKYICIRVCIIHNVLIYICMTKRQRIHYHQLSQTMYI
jgi:hypothetical protein